MPRSYLAVAILGSLIVDVRKPFFNFSGHASGLLVEQICSIISLSIRVADMQVRKYLRHHARCVTDIAREKLTWALPVMAALSLGVSGCHSKKASAPFIEFTKVPEARAGGTEAIAKIEGRVHGARLDERIVLFKKTDRWWIQPGSDQPFTEIRRDSTWSNSTHFGMEYAALLVAPGYRPPPTADFLPVEGGAVRAVAIVKGIPGPSPTVKTIHFSGYDWNVRTASSNRGGVDQLYDPENAWTDGFGAMHFRITLDSGRWHCAEVNLTRSLGYGTYRYVVREASFLEPATVLSMFTWDDTSPEQNHREFGVEIARWGEPTNRNAQFVVQPYYVPANVARFMAPSGRITYSVRWRPESLSFQAVQVEGKANPHMIAEHTFISGIPTPGNESVHMNLYVFGSWGTSRIPLKQQTEVVIEKFEYIP